MGGGAAKSSMVTTNARPYRRAPPPVELEGAMEGVDRVLESLTLS
jgi:hypothetical protein